MTDKTKVIFRVFKDGGDVIAIFPEDPATLDPYTCNSYQHLGQHGACNPTGLIAVTTAAKPEQYQDLKEELESIGYDLEVIKRLRHDHLEVRRQELKRMIDHVSGSVE